MSVCRLQNFSLINISPLSTVILPRVATNVFKSVFEFILLETVIWRSSMFPEKSLRSESSTALPISPPEDALTDLIAYFTVGITKISIAVNIASCTLASTSVITLAISLRTLLTMYYSSVCTSTWRPLSWLRSFVFPKAIFSSAMVVLLLGWASWLFRPITKSVSDSLN